MPFWNLPWSTFGAFLVLDFTILLAIGWALWDRSQEKKDKSREDSR